MWTTWAALAIAGTAIATPGSGAGTVCIEARRATAGLLLVPVEVAAGGVQKSYWFLLDTGSGVTLVDDEVAAALALTPTSRTTVVTSNGSVAATTATLSLRFGAVRADGLEVVHHPLRELRAVSPDVHGVIGQDVLRRTNWLLDYKRGLVVQDPSRTLNRRDGAERVGVRWLGDRPIVDASFHRSSLPLVLDSAATSVVLYALPTDAAPATFARMQTIGAVREAPLVAIDSLRVGTITVAHPVAAVAPQDVDADEARGVLPTSLFESLYFDHHDGAALVRRAQGSEGAGRIIRPRCDAAGSLSSWAP